MAPELTLYHATHACSTVVHCLLEDLGLPFKEIKMKMGPNGIQSVDGTINRDEYLKIHHMGYVPALVADGESITEMPAILSYIANLRPEKCLLGDDSLQQARVLEWLSWLSGALHGHGFAMAFQPGRFTDDKSQGPHLRAKGLDFVRKCYARIDERLEGREYPVGNRETVVDFNLIIFWLWGLEQEIDMPGLYPEYGRLITRMARKETVKKVDIYAQPALKYIPKEEETKL
ncbi:uncharacterized protein E0L32_002450 [Thyridium curvatum]|uniref:Glutathione S-transferase n=1 Tax=Thyridium curvatum TaxID=1093900 RepID=A0A507BGH7_9PEZI|nr:uncharacterized protein E0L32_002450 [Thyridium curvatum]TPX18593.1 hypothetical protein E0L32_002450 [Thyridium curvatum]